jgi:CRP-like cAMP-binding protein
MTHFQTATSYGGSIDRPHLRSRRSASTPDITSAVYSLLREALSGYDTAGGDRHSDIRQAVTHVYELGNRQPFPSRSIANSAHVLLAGWAFRSQILQDGARQITDLIVPGDFCFTPFCGEEPLSQIEACGSARVVVLDLQKLPDRVRTLVEHSQRAQHVDMVRRLRARLVSLGRRDARERLAYLVAETYARLTGVGLAPDATFKWPITQEHLADLLGLTPVHTNRVLARLRSEDLLVIRNRQVAILDVAGLGRAGGFEDSYSHDDGGYHELL